MKKHQFCKEISYTKIRSQTYRSKPHKVLLLLIFLVSISTIGLAQEDPWRTNTAHRATIIKEKAVERLSFPTDLKLFNLNTQPFDQKLFSIVEDRIAKRSTLITLPNTDGNIEQFEIFEASNFEPDLQARFPEIRAYSGKGITDQHATVKLSISPQGLQAMIFRADGQNEYIEPYSKDHSIYAVFRPSTEKGLLPWTCSTVDKNMAHDIGTQLIGSNITRRSGGNLKTLRLAQSVTAEYSNYFGATSASQVSLVLAAINATLTRCNGIFERDLALHLDLIAASTNVIYYNAATDPYSNADVGAKGKWSNELQQTLTSVIGEANYNIGHLFGAAGGGGSAGCIGCICTNGNKGSAFTSPADRVPQGDNFDIDYVAHEIGHQLGANHTFSMENEGYGVSKEVGSGISIMGYAGITSQNVAAHSIAMFHQASITQIQANLSTKTCAVTSTIANATPVVAPMSNYTIPKSTPFALTGSATDANAGDVLTYCWEQNDNGSTEQQEQNSIASPTKVGGPNWISFLSTTSPTRYFPKLSTILSGALVSGPLSGGGTGINSEALSSVARTLNFRLTVRDNAPYRATAPISVGQTNFTDVQVTVNGSSGPFSVTVPNTAVSWVGGSARTITWAVANTTAAPVSCANVKISLSTDGGQTFPTVLAASTANDGTEEVLIPNTASTTARIKVEAVGNIFFDISNSNFTITAGTSSCGSPTGLNTSLITTNSATVSWLAVNGASNYDVSYALASSSIWINVATASTSLSVDLNGLTSGSTYKWRVRTNCANGNSGYTNAEFTTGATATCNDPENLSSSAIGNNNATVGWNAVNNAASYDVAYKVAGSSTWTNVAIATTATSVNINGLTAATTYDWRVRTNCNNGNSRFIEAQFSTTSTTSCSSAFEPNETQATATNINLGDTNSAAISTATDIDHYRIVTSVTSDIVYKLVGPGSIDLDLYIYNSNGTLIGSGTGNSATETVSLAAQQAGTYYIKVAGHNGAKSLICYTINATATSSTSCQGIYDVSTNGNISGAASIPFDTDVKGMINSRTDIDNYKFIISAAGRISLSLSTLPADYDLRLLNSAGTQVSISQNGNNNSESINYNATAGTYYAQVLGYNGANNSTTCYTLKAQLSPASKLAADMVNTIKVYPNPVTDILHIDLVGRSGMGSIKIIDVRGAIVLEQKIINDPQSIDVSRLAKGIYVLKINNNGVDSISKFMKQ